MASPEDIFLRRLDILMKLDNCLRKRIIIALAGAPGSGKSTVAEALSKRFNKKHTHQLQIVPMDGFHFTKATLLTMPNDPDPFQRRGAPFTFDAESFVHLVQRLSYTPVTEMDEPEKAIWAPSFDHRIKDPVERDIRISSAQKIILLEGNYLLLDEHPWRSIRDLVDETWFISVPRNVSKERLVARHMRAGIEPDLKSAEARVESNDLLNWDLINRKSLIPDVIVESIPILPSAEYTLGR